MTMLQSGMLACLQFAYLLLSCSHRLVQGREPVALLRKGEVDIVLVATHAGSVFPRSLALLNPGGNRVH